MGITTFALLMRNKGLLQAAESDEGWRAWCIAKAQFPEPTVQVLFIQLPTLVPRCLSKTKEEHIANLRENCCDIRRYRRNRSWQCSSSCSLVRPSLLPSSPW